MEDKEILNEIINRALKTFDVNQWDNDFCFFSTEDIKNYITIKNIKDCLPKHRLLHLNFEDLSKEGQHYIIINFFKKINEGTLFFLEKMQKIEKELLKKY